MSAATQAVPAREQLARALAATRRAGADAADVVLFESESLAARVRSDRIDFVTQANEHSLGIRALVRGNGLCVLRHD